MRECAELRRLLGQVLDVLAEQRDRDVARRLAQIREVFRHFDLPSLNYLQCPAIGVT